jgi:uncharacterized phage protein (TIGR02218 family)
MKTLPANLVAHYAQQVTTLCLIWTVTRRDGQVYRFTDADRDLVFNGATYLSTAGYSAASVRASGDFAVDSTEAQTMESASGLTAASVEAGLWDGATVRLARINYAAPADGEEVLRVGTIGEMRLERGQISVEIRGLLQALQATTGRVILPLCDAKLGDARCGVNLAALTVAGTVTSVVSRVRFVASGLAQAADYFSKGEVVFTSGANAGARMEVNLHQAGGDITLALPMPADILVGDAFTVSPGCRKRLDPDCKTKFNNVVNFRGFPHIPGLDEMLRPGGV